MSDPYAVLGLKAGATDEQVAVAYRDLAKRHHPDLAPADGDRMREINAAYDEIVRSASPARVPPRNRRPPAARPRPGAAPGAWLPAPLRRQLGRELLEALQPLEEVLVVAAAASWDSPNLLLVATDRRLLWLRDDAPVARVRFLRYSVLDEVEGRVNRRRRVGELRVKPRDAKRVAFAGMTPEHVEAVLRVARPRVRPMPKPEGRETSEAAPLGN